jgi:modulator of FtsH protease
MWTNFFITSAEAAAALAGLVIVATSVNINRILQYRHLPFRAGATIATLILVLVIGLVTLIPQRESCAGFEILIFGFVCWLLEIRSSQLANKARVERQRPVFESVLETTLGQVQTIPLVIGGALMYASRPTGVYYVATGIVAIFIASTLNVWVLTVEILR